MDKSYGFDSFPTQAVETPPPWVLLVALGFLLCAFVFWMYIALNLVAPVPRPPRRSEKQFVTILENGERSSGQELPCWMDRWAAEKEAARRKAVPGQVVDMAQVGLEGAEVFMSVVVPAFNEEDRLIDMLEEAFAYLQTEFGGAKTAYGRDATKAKGWEIIIVDDGSTDATVDKALNFARSHPLSRQDGSIRIISLEANRGKGGAVTHGMRHVRGQYVVFADADGASRFSDLEKLVQGCQAAEDKSGRGVAVGSRAHLVGSDVVVKRSKLRNFLMHSFHLLLRLMTPPATAAIKDTQCGFKLFSRPSLPYIIPYMHSEGWIFDVEMLMLAESANIPMVEVAIGWKEVMGSKLNVVWDSLGMAWGLAILRASWLCGVYKRD